jgi:hypothetical protein
MNNAPRIVYAPRPGATPEAELNAVAACYRFILFEGSASKKEAVELTLDPYAAARVNQEEEVSHVEQRRDRSPQITLPAAL